MNEEEIQDVDTATFTTHELAVMHGQKPGAPVQGDDPFTAVHNVAAVMNGWTMHLNRTGEEPRFTSDQYLGALNAAKEGKAFASTNKRPPRDMPAAESKPKKKRTK